MPRARLTELLAGISSARNGFTGVTQRRLEGPTAGFFKPLGPRYSRQSYETFRDLGGRSLGIWLEIGYSFKA